MGEITTFVMEHTTCVDPRSLFMAITDEILIIGVSGQAYDRISIDDNYYDNVKTHSIYLDGSLLKTTKHDIEMSNEETMVYIYSVVEGDDDLDLEGKFKKIHYRFEVKSCEKGSICKISSTFYPFGDFKLTEEDIKGIKVKSSQLFKAIEAYLVKYPWANNVGY